MKPLTGLMRFQITRAWLKRGAEGNLDDFVKEVCKQKQIEYKPVNPLIIKGEHESKIPSAR